jgi:ATP-dependent helicase/nuclease subunit A
VDLWSRRRKDFAIATKSAVFLTPTLLKRREEELSEAAAQVRSSPGVKPPAMIVGDLAHRFLQSWDFGSTPGALVEQLPSFVERCLPRAYHEQQTEIHNELEAIFNAFFDSKAYAELAAARILGREVPLLMPWDRQIMEGVIDIMYERNGLLYLADYKTDRISRNQAAGHATHYFQQAEIYTRAAQRSLQRNVAAFKLIFLRIGEAVEVRLPQTQGELFG